MADSILPLKLLSNPTKFPLWHPYSRRMHHIFLLMAGFCACTFMRINLAITMTCMVNSTAVAIEEQMEYDFDYESTAPSEYTWSTSFPSFYNGSLFEENSGGTCQKSSGKKVIIDYGGSLIWNHKIQNILFSANFWGGSIVVMPSMFLIQKYSPRILLFLAVALYVLSTAGVPYLAMNLPYYFVFVSRFIMGLGDSIINPAANAVIANWFPVNERSTAVALFTTGNQIAGAGGNPIAAALCQSQWEWPSVFYLAAFVGVVWCTVWGLTSSDHPSLCKTITREEKLYLEVNCLKMNNKNRPAPTVPYRRIFTSLPFLAVLICQFQVNFFITLFQVYLPSYFKDILQLGVMSNGAFSSIPNIFMFICKIAWSILMDKLKEKKVLTPTECVKLSQSVASFGSALCLILIGLFVDCSRPTLALVLLCLTFSFVGTFTSGVYTSMLSLAPRFTGTLSSVSLLVSILARLATPSIVGFIKETGSQEEWQTLFNITAVAACVAGVIFLIFGDGDMQDWGRDKSESLRMSKGDLAETPSLQEELPEGFEEIVSVQRTRTESVCI